MANKASSIGPLERATRLASADERMTAERQETKFLLPEVQVLPLVQAINRHLEPHRYRGKGANPLPAAQHFVTTIYFDTPSRTHYRTARDFALANVKIRAKEYYDVHPGLIEIATDPSQFVRYQPALWFELKQRIGPQTLKQRFRLAKQEIPSIFGSGAVPAERLARLLRAVSPPAAVEEIARHCEALDEDLAADCLVNYRRLAWQDADAELRVTIDLCLTVFSPPADLWTRRRALVRSSLGTPLFVVPDAVVEVKGRQSEPPRWLCQSLARTGAREAPVSKFYLASHIVHQAPRTAPSQKS
jgi:hypothetical protein